MNSSPVSHRARSTNLCFQVGRIFFAAGIAFFGFQYVLYGHYLGGTPPVPPWTPENAAAAYAVGILMLAAGIGLIMPKFDRWSALIVGAFYLACVVFLHLLLALLLLRRQSYIFQQLQPYFPHLLHPEIVFSGRERTRALEPLSLAAAAFALASLLRSDQASSEGLVSDAFLRRFGILVFAFALPVYGYQHFEYFNFLANLLPSWMPAHKFLIAFTGVAFIAAGLAILFRVLARPAAIWLGIMFLVFVCTLHVPRVAHNAYVAEEWASLFMALAMCGASWIVAEAIETLFPTKTQFGVR